MPLTVIGTMCSGDPYTTLGNTFRQLLYSMYYTRFLTRVDHNAAGDDSNMPCHNPAEVRQAVLQNTSRDNLTPSPLGQIVKSVDYGPLETAEFCSKWFFLVQGKLVATRDLRKVLATKQFYSRKNQHLLRNPHLHRLAILQGLHSESASKLLEAMIDASVATHVASATDQDVIDAYIKK